MGILTVLMPLGQNHEFRGADVGEAVNAFGQTAPVNSLSLIHPVVPAGSPLLAVWSGAGSKLRNRRRTGETPASGTKLSYHGVQPFPLCLVCRQRFPGGWGWEMPWQS